MEIKDIDIYLVLAINGIFTGVGITLGAYVAENHIIKKLGKIIKKIFK